MLHVGKYCTAKQLALLPAGAGGAGKVGFREGALLLGLVIAVFVGARLLGLVGTRLVGPRLVGIRLVGLMGTRLVGVPLVGTRLVGIRVVGARVVGLVGTRLVGARLVGLVGARLVGTPLVGTRVVGLVGARLVGTRLVGARAGALVGLLRVGLLLEGLLVARAVGLVGCRDPRGSLGPGAAGLADLLGGPPGAALRGSSQHDSSTLRLQKHAESLCMLSTPQRQLVRLADANTRCRSMLLFRLYAHYH